VGTEPGTLGSAELYKEKLGEAEHLIRKEMSRYRMPPDQQWTVPAGHYFMMGDNRDNSNDSRYWGRPEHSQGTARHGSGPEHRRQGLRGVDELARAQTQPPAQPVAGRPDPLIHGAVADSAECISDIGCVLRDREIRRTSMADHSQTVFQDVDLNNALNNERVAA
jgi:hypothetical protein